MSLIDKNSPSLFVHEKRPLKVSSILLSVITKIVHKRMNKVCEREGFYGSCQFGFCQNCSTTDCVFFLLAAICKAKRNGYQIYISLCDLAKGYDSANRELLYTCLDSLGLGGKVKSFIQ